MKKLMLMVTMLMVGIAVMAQVKQPASAELFASYQSAINGADVKTARAVLAGMDFTGADVYAKAKYVSCQMITDGADGKLPKTVAEVVANVAKYSAECGLADKTAGEYYGLDSLVIFKANQLAYDYAKTLTLASDSWSAGCRRLLSDACLALGKYDEASAIAIASKDYPMAMRIFIAQGEPVKAYEYAQKSLLTANVSAEVLSSVLTDLTNTSFIGTPVTDEMQIKFLSAVNIKYSRFMVEKPEVWTPIITSLRTTLKEMKEAVK